MAVTPALESLKQEDNHKFEASLNYVARPCLKKKSFSYHQYLI